MNIKSLHTLVSIATLISCVALFWIVLNQTSDGVHWYHNVGFITGATFISKVKNESILKILVGVNALVIVANLVQIAGFYMKG